MRHRETIFSIAIEEDVLVKNTLLLDVRNNVGAKSIYQPMKRVVTSLQLGGAGRFPNSTCT